MSAPDSVVAASAAESSGPAVSDAEARTMSDDVLLERVRARAHQYFSGPHAIRCEVQEVEAHDIGGEIRVRFFRVSWPDMHRMVLTKTFLSQDQDPAHRARAERLYRRDIEAFQAVSSRAGGTASRRPRVLETWDDLTTLVLGGVEVPPPAQAIGDMVETSLLPRDGIHRSRALREAHRVGQWLGRLHTSTYIGLGSVDVNVPAGLSARAGGAPAARDPSVARLGKWFRVYSNRLLDIAHQTRDSLVVPIALSGGDPPSGSPMIGQTDGVWPVGGSANRLEPVYADVARFLTAFRTIGTSLRTPAQFLRIQRAFLTGYASAVQFELAGRRQGLRFFMALSYLLTFTRMVEARPRSRHIRWPTPVPWLQMQWIRVRYIWPMGALMQSIERREWRRSQRNGSWAERGFQQADRFRGQRAREYDGRRQRRFVRLLQWANEAAVRRVAGTATRGAERVLDAPCGTGRLLPMLARSTGSVIGADISEEMVAQAVRKHGPTAGAPVRLVVMSAQELGFQDGAFDCVSCIRLLHLLPPHVWTGVLRELARVSSRHVIITAPIGAGGLLVETKSLLLRGRRPRRERVTWARMSQIVQSAGLEIGTWTRSIPFFWDETVLLLRHPDHRGT